MSKDVSEVKAVGLKQLLQKAKNDIGAALPKHLTADRMVRIATTEFRKNPKLLECAPASFLGAIIQASQLGLEPGSALGHCWLIPYKTECNFQIGYKGMLELAMRSGKVSHIAARSVHEGDEFEWEFGLHEKLVHKPAADQGPLTHVYCVVHLLNGCKMFDVMSKEEVEIVRKSSKSANNGPWVTHPIEMAKKTVVRRLFKYMPVSVEMQKAVNLDELDESGKSQNNSSIVETTGRNISEEPDFASTLAESFESDSDPSGFGNFTGSTVVSNETQGNLK